MTVHLARVVAELDLEYIVAEVLDDGTHLTSNEAVRWWSTSKATTSKTFGGEVMERLAVSSTTVGAAHGQPQAP